MGEQPLVVIVGLQKSGTSLALRLLERTGLYENPLSFEAKELWGDVPPFAPAEYPTGHFYRLAGGERGHELGASEASEEVSQTVRGRLADAATGRTAVVLKSPYATVRIPWLRAIFPEAHIVALVRRPLPNVFSLLKKHVQNPHARRGPEEGWWGVKPAGWRELRSDDAVLQVSRQWDRVNAKLWEDRKLTDAVVRYHELCADPQGFVAGVAEATLGETPALDFSPLDPQDSEALEGGPLESANKVFKRTGELALAGAARAGERLAGLSESDRRTVAEVCGPLAERMGLELSATR